MGLFSKGTEGGLMDVIRCDEPEYLIWKWRPSGGANSTRKENAIRWGSSLRVKDGEVAVLVYKQPDGPIQDFIEGPFDATLKTANLPVISKLVGLAYGGDSPFQAEIYFINLAGNVRRDFGLRYFDVSDPRFIDFPLKVRARGSYLFNITDYRSFIKLHRLIDFDLETFHGQVLDAVTKYVKAIITNAPMDHGIPPLQLERKILEINDLVEARVRGALVSDFGVNLKRFDLATIEIDKEAPEYAELRAVTADLQTQTLQAQTGINIQNMQVQAANMEDMLRIQRKASELQVESQNLAAHQMNLQAGVLTTAAQNLGEMGAMNLGGGGGGGTGGGGFNPVGVMTGMAIGGAMGGQMAGMMNMAGQNMQQSMSAPPPVPPVAYHVIINGQQAGPFNMVQVQELVHTGQLTPMTNVWKQGMASWAAASTVAELAGLCAVASPPPPPPPPPGV